MKIFEQSFYHTWRIFCLWQHINEDTTKNPLSGSDFMWKMKDIPGYGPSFLIHSQQASKHPAALWYARRETPRGAWEKHSPVELCQAPTSTHTHTQIQPEVPSETYGFMRSIDIFCSTSCQTARRAMRHEEFKKKNTKRRLIKPRMDTLKVTFL